MLFLYRYKTKPSEDYEDPQDVLAIKNAKENMGDFKLKTAEDYTVPEHLRINAEQKRSELAILESIVRTPLLPAHVRFTVTYCLSGHGWWKGPAGSCT